MADWAAGLDHAVGAAEVAAARPVPCAVSDALQSGQPLQHVVISPRSMARLLDLAILTGDETLAALQASQSPYRPLRRWTLSCPFLACEGFSILGLLTHHSKLLQVFQQES